MARPTLAKHPKFRRLVHVLGEPRPHVRGYLELIWEVAYESGNPVIGDATDVELAAEYPGTPGALAAALLQVRLMDKDEQGRYLVHDLPDHAPDYVRKRMVREQGRKHRYAPRDRPLSAAWRSNGAETRPENELGGIRRTPPDSGSPPAPAPAPIKKKRTQRSTFVFVTPRVEEVAAYCRERGNRVDAEAFHSHYQSNGWKVGKNPMRDWKAAVRTWERNEGKFNVNGRGAAPVDLFASARAFAARTAALESNDEGTRDDAR